MARGILIGCGGLLGILVLLVILGRLLGGGGQDTAQKPEEDKEPTKEEKAAKKDTRKGKEEAPTARIGDVVAVGDAAWVVTDARYTNQLPDQFGLRPAKQGNFVIVDFDFRNDGNDAKTLHHGALRLFDGSGRESSVDTDSFSYIPQEKNIFLEQVNPGVSKAGQVVFTVAPDASNFELELRGTNIFSTDKARVDLGF